MKATQLLPKQPNSPSQSIGSKDADKKSEIVKVIVKKEVFKVKKKASSFKA